MKRWRVEHAVWLVLMLSFAVAAVLVLGMRQDLTERLQAQSLDSLLSAARSLHAQGKTAEALHVFDALVRRYPESERVLVECAQLMEQQGRLAEAERLYERATSQGRQRFSSVRRYAVFLDQAGRPDDAVTLYESYLRQYPDDLAAHMDLGLRYMRNQQWAAAVDSLTLAAKKPDLEFASRTNLATAYVRTGHTQEAIAEWERVVAMGPEREKQMYLQDIAAAEASEGRLDDSIETWRRYMEHFPNSIFGVTRILKLCERVASPDVCARAALRARAVSPPRTTDLALTNRIHVAGVSELSGEMAPGGILTGDVYFNIVATVTPEAAPAAQFLLVSAGSADFSEAASLTGEPARVGSPPLWRGDTVRQTFSFELPRNLTSGAYLVGLNVTPGGATPVTLWTIQLSGSALHQAPVHHGGERP